MIKINKVTLSVFIIALFMFSIASIGTSRAHVETGGDCTTPTTTLTITAAPTGKDSDVTFDKQDLTVDMGVCFTMKFINMAPTQQHSFVIDAAGDFNGVHIHLMNSTAGPDGGNSDQTNIMAPSSATDLTFYCGVSGHKAAGMSGTLHVVDPNAKSPGFTMPLTIVSLVSIMVVGSIIRQKKMKAVNY